MAEKLSKDYEVGKNKPPMEHQFKPGRSGNPRGRPKKSKFMPPEPPEERMKDIFLEEAYRPIRIRDGDKVETVPMIQAVVRSIAVEAARGDRRAQRMFTQVTQSIEDARADQRYRTIEAALNYKENWRQEFERCNAAGIKPPVPDPHPDDLIIDPDKNAVFVRERKKENGNTQRTKKQEHHDNFDREIEFAAEMLGKDPGDRAALAALKEAVQLKNLMNKLSPDE